MSRLIYTNSGSAILALVANAVHKLWKWPRSERHPAGKVLWLIVLELLFLFILNSLLTLNSNILPLLLQASASIVPQLWQPASGILMTNDISDTNPEDAVPCFALSKNDSYVMSASGGKISLFNMMTFKV